MAISTAKINIGNLERYLYFDCRVILLAIIGKDVQSFTRLNGLNHESVINFVKYNYTDYINSIRGTNKSHRYLTAVNCVRILENAGYKIELTLKLSDNEV